MSQPEKPRSSGLLDASIAPHLTPAGRPVIDWSAGPARRIACPACATHAAKPFVLYVHVGPWPTSRLALYRCPECDSKFFADFEYPEYATTLYGPSAIKFYVEAGAGIDQLVAPLFAVAMPPGARYLDVGCGYGFAVDFAHHALRLDALGVDPSQFAAAGRTELGASIIQDYLSPELDLGRLPFELVVASEVIEHVKDPLIFLKLIRGRLEDRGALILTTPDAESVTPEAPEAALTLLLSPKLHHVLFSRQSLEHVLRTAGFRNVVVMKRSDTLVAAASCGDRSINLRAPIDRGLFIEYLRRRRASVQADSWLAHGLSYRLCKELTNAAAYSEALQAFANLAESVYRVYKFDIQHPDLSAIDASRDETFCGFAHRFPMNLAGIGYFRGLVALNHEGQRDRAAAYFELAYRYATALEEQLARIGCADAEMDNLAWQSRWLNLRALSYQNPEAAADQALALAGHQDEVIPPNAYGRLRLRGRAAELFAHLVDLGALHAAERLVPTIVASLQDPALSKRQRYASLRALGLLSLNHWHAPRLAAGQFLAAERTLSRLLIEDPQAAGMHSALWRTRYERMLALVVAADAQRALRAARRFQLCVGGEPIPEDVMRDAQAIVRRLQQEATSVNNQKRAEAQLLDERSTGKPPKP